ncbi:MAG: NUDIX hydrolase [Coprothermobacterota bacterium]|nr:NUDIX hydrolase [Coprothermobacterota bacterium]
MRYGISAGALVIKEGCLLLVHHRIAGAFDFWVPPGGRLEGEESIFDCARRETREETGLEVLPERIVYIQEFLDKDLHFCKFFLFCPFIRGTLSLAGRQEDESFLVDARFFSRAGLEGRMIYPAILHDLFWQDLMDGFPVTRYLGLERIEEPTLKLALE